jgi:hypothetical protein
MTHQPDTRAQQGTHLLGEATQLLECAKQDPAFAQPAAATALRALLLFLEQEPRGDRVVSLLEQTAEVDEALAKFRSDALTLDGGTFETPGDAYERAKLFVDAARARVVNI